MAEVEVEVDTDGQLQCQRRLEGALASLYFRPVKNLVPLAMDFWLDGCSESPAGILAVQSSGPTFDEHRIRKVTSHGAEKRRAESIRRSVVHWRAVHLRTAPMALEGWKTVYCCLLSKSSTKEATIL